MGHGIIRRRLETLVKEETMKSPAKPKMETHNVIQIEELPTPAIRKCDSCSRWAFWKMYCYNKTGIGIVQYACSDYSKKKSYRVEKDLFKYLVTHISGE
jgi:hypothetical protein